MKKDSERTKGGRRDFLRLAGVGGLAAGAAVLAGGTPQAEAAQPEASGSGYQESEHVRKFYETARF